MSVAVLIFCLNEVEGVLRNIRSMQEFVDEIILVDSSSPEDHEALRSLASPYSAKIYHALPLGFPEPLRPFGLSKVESDYALILDADEEASVGLRSDLRDLHEHEAYVLPRLEEGLRSYTYHLRLLRPAAVRFRYRSFDFPEVLGHIGHLDKSRRLIHHADYSNYLTEKARAQRYFTIENVERPFNRQYGRESLTTRFTRRSVSVPLTRGLLVPPETPLSSRMIGVLINFEFLRDMVLGKGLRAASFNRRYSLGKRRFLLGLSDAERDFLQAAAIEVQRSGGLFRYLGLDNPAYVDQLTRSFQWNLRGIDVYKNLLRYRLNYGEPADSVPVLANPNAC
ncbi:MAG TPA: glycosyltransferase [Thermoplasmata archaeon]|nr:glycosyltransferase [Thermoplasmata archaeon]